MKAYSKPRLVALSLNANDLLCGCKFDVIPGGDGNVDPAIQRLYESLGINKNNNPFSGNHPCDTNIDTSFIETYCKFGPFPSDTMIFSS